LLLQVLPRRVTLAWARLTDLATAFPATTHIHTQAIVQDRSHIHHRHTVHAISNKHQTSQKIVQDLKTLTSPYLEKLSRDLGGTTTVTTALRTNYGAENIVGQNQGMELAEALN